MHEPTEQVQKETGPRSVSELQPKMKVEGVVKETPLHGAVIDLGLEYDGLIHISQLAPRRVSRVTDVVKPGDRVTAWVLKVNHETRTVALTMIEPPAVEWDELAEGQIRKGVVVRLEPYGAFVDIGAERPGLLHVREMSTGYVRHPSELVKEGDEVEVRILAYDRRKRRIDLSMLGVAPEEEVSETASDDETPAMTTMELALKRAQSAQPRSSHPRTTKRVSPEILERQNILLETLKQHAKR